MTTECVTGKGAKGVFLSITRDSISLRDYVYQISLYTGLMSKKAKLKYLDRRDLDSLFTVIKAMDYTVFGPVKRDSAIVYEELASADNLPVGYRDQQEGGSYRLEPTGDDSLFSYVVGPDSWKKYLFPPQETLFKASKQDGKLSFEATKQESVKRAFFGVRSCELHAITIQDKVFTGGEFTDVAYASRREDLLLIAVNCSRSAATCFCTSLDTGPKAKEYFDLALTEILNKNEHYFLLEVGSETGELIVENMCLGNATQEHKDAAEQVSQQASEQQRSLKISGLKEKIYKNVDNESFWTDVAERCLNCANCTMVCPTCFCSTVEDVTDLAGESTERVRSWDSCFNASHSYIAGGSIRDSGESRYRQWFMHKLASWQDQFDSLGCVGCGRCITWCPVGIDLTAEVDRLYEDENIPVEKTTEGGDV
jgi:sulfhydrogenase subunit beta (sulfur reductase)